MFSGSFLPYLTGIINHSIATFSFPDELKLAEVMSAFKKDDPLDKENYRPISLLSHTSKIYVKILFNQISGYIEPYFSDLLTGFWRNHSTQHCLIKMLEKWKHLLNTGYKIGVLFMDLSKPHDVLNHSLLLVKLDPYGFSLKSTTFIQSYLNKKMQKVNVNNKFSACKDIYSGVPQGSILGPLLFNIFINDIFSFLTTCDMCNYADDNTLYTYSRNFHQVQEYLKKDFQISKKWFCDNGMVLNPGKCEFMGFGKTNENKVFTYHEIRLKKTTTTKLLGITIDLHLNFNEHF